MGEELDWCNTLRQQHTDKARTDETSGVWTEKDLTKRSCGLDMHGWILGLTARQKKMVRKAYRLFDKTVISSSLWVTVPIYLWIHSRWYVVRLCYSRLITSYGEKITEAKGYFWHRSNGYNNIGSSTRKIRSKSLTRCAKTAQFLPQEKEKTNCLFNKTWQIYEGTTWCRSWALHLGLSKLTSSPMFMFTPVLTWLTILPPIMKTAKKKISSGFWFSS